MATQEKKPISGSSEDPQIFDEAFDALAKEALDFYHVPGLAIGVIHKGKTYAKVWKPQVPIHQSPACSWSFDLSKVSALTLVLGLWLFKHRRPNSYNAKHALLRRKHHQIIHGSRSVSPHLKIVRL
jgi:hypothetical protein